MRSPADDGEAWARRRPPKGKTTKTGPRALRSFVSPRAWWWRDGREYPEHLFIPDTQVHAGVPIDHIRWAAEYALAHKPDAIVMGNDWWDFPSLNTHEAEWADFRVRDLADDLCSGLHAWDLFHATLAKEPRYQPAIYFLEGNHDERWRRMFRFDKRFEALLPGPRHFVAATPRVKWVALEEIVRVDGVCYSHYFVQPRTGRPLGGTAQHRLTQLKFSFTQGHVQTKEMAEQHLGDGRVLRGIVCGAFYEHREDYLGWQGNLHWRGMLHKHEVRDGNYDLLEVSLGYLRRKFGRGKAVAADPRWRRDEFEWGVLGR